MTNGMARQLRIQGAGLSYHVWSRGNGRRAIFLDDHDRLRFLDVLGDVCESHAVDCLAFCQMTNHYHLVITTNRPNLSRAVKRVNGLYAMWWNHRHDHVGHVFQGRFGAQVVHDETYLLTACRYTVLNPVRAGLVQHPSLWPWSSYLATAGIAHIPPCLRPQGLWALLGDAGAAGGQRLYRQFLDVRLEDVTALPRDRVVGDVAFQERFRDLARAASREVPRREREVRPPLPTYFDGAGSRVERGARASRAYLAGYPLVEIARFLGVHYTTVARMIRDSGGWEGDPPGVAS